MHARRHLFRCAVLLAATLLFPMVGNAAAPTPEQVFLNSKDVKWASAPPSLPKGAKIAVLYGDPGSDGTYVMRLMTPSGYKLPPHWHAQAQQLTVISGALYLTTMDAVGNKTAQTLKSGAFVRLPANARRAASTKSTTVIEIHGQGPFAVNYVNADDDPQKWASGKPYYFPSQYELHATEPGERSPSF